MSLVVISGYSRVGKDTFGKLLQKHLKDDYFLAAYATYLKNVVRDCFNLSHDQLYGDLKQVPDKRYSKRGTEPVEYWTPREFLQYVGEMFRQVDPDYWINKLFEFIERNKLKNVIITDGRHENEINRVLGCGGKHIRIYREIDDRKIGLDHISEVALDDFDRVDYVVHNDYTIEDLDNVAKEIAKEISLNG